MTNPINPPWPYNSDATGCDIIQLAIAIQQASLFEQLSGELTKRQQTEIKLTQSRDLDHCQAVSINDDLN